MASESMVNLFRASRRLLLPRDLLGADTAHTQPRVFGKVLDSKNAKTGRVFGDYLPPISYVVAEANGPREGQGITHSITRTSERRTGGLGGDFIPFHPVWLVLSTDDILHLLVVAHGFPTPLGLGEYFLAPFIIVNLRRAILTPTACVCSVAQ